MEKVYDTTKEECQKMIDEQMPIVCSSCGHNSIKPFETVNNAGEPTFWPVCSDCQVVEYGTHPDIYETARKMVDDNRYREYSFEEEPDKERFPLEHDYWRKSQIRGACSTIRQIVNVYQQVSRRQEQSTT